MIERICMTGKHKCQVGYYVWWATRKDAHGYSCNAVRVDFRSKIR